MTPPPRLLRFHRLITLEKWPSLYTDSPELACPLEIYELIFKCDIGRSTLRKKDRIYSMQRS